MQAFSECYHKYLHVIATHGSFAFKTVTMVANKHRSKKRQVSCWINNKSIKMLYLVISLLSSH